MKNILFLISLLTCCAFGLHAQKGGTVRGNIYDKDTGEPILFCTVVLQGTTIGANTDENGFFSIGNIPAGTYNLVATYIGYDSVSAKVNVREGAIVSQNLLMQESSIELGTVEISSRREQARSDVQVSKVTVSARQIKALPSTGGQTDIAQYLPVLPGIISTGDQGGQIYIRGGSPIQNRILLDGMTIYNPFHSIGFFSVFETEAIKTVDVLTAGFNAEYGGRVSAIIDLKTREGNKKRLAGLVSANPFQAKALLEGPIKKFQEGGGSSSFLFTAKHAYIDKTSPVFYSYAVDTTFYSVGETPNDEKPDNLPFRFTDIYGKLSFVTPNGSKLNLFGFNFYDRVDYAGVASLSWNTAGGGTNFTLIPPNSNLVIGGVVAYSNYEINLVDADNTPSASRISNYNIILDFTNYGLRSEVKYGFDVAGLDTDFRFTNSFDRVIQQQSFTTELAGFVKLKYKIGDWIVEPSLRLQFYPSQSASSLEPRFGAKYNVTDNFRLKMAGGRYSQNLIGSVNDRDVVNLFVGFLTGPEEQISDLGTGNQPPHRLQKSWHAVVGAEVDLAKNLELNVEPYYKYYDQLIVVNRNKLNDTDPSYATETGKAYGIDFTLRYEANRLFLWGTYSLAYVNWYDGEQTYPTIFDRRHNINLLGTYAFGKNKDWEAAVRWNLGSGFPFTKTQGFYNDFQFQDGLGQNPLTENGELGIILDEKRNGGRLPYYHRLDVSLKKTWKIGKNLSIEAVASATNLYNRDNIFYYDRIRNQRINQLPIMPSVGLTVNF